MFQLLGVFAEFERAMIQERVKAGLERARAQGKILGRPKLKGVDEAGIRAAVQADGLSVRQAPRRFAVTPSKVQRVLKGPQERRGSGGGRSHEVGALGPLGPLAGDACAYRVR